MDPNVIAVTISNGKVSTDPAEPTGALDDTVIWRFEGNVAEQELKVRPKGSEPLSDSPEPNQISGQIFPTVEGGDRFEYDIIQGTEELPWANQANGGSICIKNPGPPGGQPRQEQTGSNEVQPRQGQTESN